MEKNVGIIGTGHYVPDKVMTNADYEKIIDTSDEWIKTMTGVKERRFAAQNQATSDLCVEAAKMALNNAKMSIDNIDLIIVATVSPDHLAQSTATIVSKKLGVNNNIPAFDLSAACSGFIYSLTMAHSLIKSGTYKNILVLGAETLSRFINMKDRNTCILFGDGAGAVILSEVEENYGILSTYLGADGEDDQVLKIPAGGSKKPNTKETINNGEQFITMKGGDVFKFSLNAFPNATNEALKSANINIDDVTLLIPHQANTRIIESGLKRLNIPKEKVFINIEKYGNTSAASIGIALSEAIQEKKIKKDDIIVMTGFGAGLTYASIVMKWYY
ncbi:beta-ketoacyl-ACP synthase III [Fusobacterium sp. PH5-44]|uniref:beta-ketoacyl-ACP synthase III n=1 Tax=unclassified Fusobacterium TaxID=2648384 RepID=UPI003D20467C